jgi:hypothetical protein
LEAIEGSAEKVNKMKILKKFFMLKQQYCVTRYGFKIAEALGY